MPKTEEKTAVYTAFAPFDIKDGRNMTSYKAGDVFAPPTGWVEVPNPDPGNVGCKFSVPSAEGEEFTRFAILPVNRG